MGTLAVIFAILAVVLVLLPMTMLTIGTVKFLRGTLVRQPKRKPTTRDRVAMIGILLLAAAWAVIGKILVWGGR